MNHAEPKVAGVLTVPRSLSPEARKHWKRLIVLLRPLGLVTALDRDAFVSLCETLAIIDKARVELRKGLIVMIRGKVSTSPFWRLLRDAECQSIRLFAEFGLTPSSRTRLFTNPVPPAPTMHQDIVDAEDYFGDSPTLQ